MHTRIARRPASSRDNKQLYIDDLRIRHSHTALDTSPTHASVGPPSHFIHDFSGIPVHTNARPAAPTTLSGNAPSTQATDLVPSAATPLGDAMDLALGLAKGKTFIPGQTRRVPIQPVFFKADASVVDIPTGFMWPLWIAKARDIWGKLGVTFDVLEPIVAIDSARKTSDDLDFVRQALSGWGMEVFVVDNPISIRKQKSLPLPTLVLAWYALHAILR